MTISHGAEIFGVDMDGEDSEAAALLAAYERKRIATLSPEGVKAEAEAETKRAAREADAQLELDDRVCA